MYICVEILSFVKVDNVESKLLTTEKDFLKKEEKFKRKG